MRNFIQYELWKDCSNACKFCFNRGQQDLDKIESLNFVIDKLDDEELNDYNEIGFIGGEFFDTQLDNKEVRTLFYKLIDKCIDKIKSNKIDKLYITTALLFDMNKHKLDLKKQKIFRINGSEDNFEFREKIICVYEYEVGCKKEK